ncbi:MAG: DNA helicase RecQ [bacterium]|nr:DNA helicase RecQ [bacterium]
MNQPGTAVQPLLERITDAVRRYWGFDRLWPLQEEAIRAGLEQRDSLVVMPTGGGKSLCYQVPPLLAERTDVVVSPLIALMKDQVDGLRTCGYPAVALHSGMTAADRRDAEREIATGQCRLVFVAPERLLTPWFMGLIERLKVRSFAVDEAHCISHWGHDFRPEYRRLAMLKERFAEASVQAYTATATARVQADIAAQLGLKDPQVLVGRFDRPNLVYRVIPRVDLHAQVLDAVRRHHREAVIVYCLSRNDTEAFAEHLQAHGVRAQAYHAGLNAERRRAAQEAFAAETLDVVVATVAFGMGIDRSNVRAVIHAAMPRSIEQYQQETGRAGRDGLEAECVLFYSAADPMRWEGLFRRNADQAEQSEEIIRAKLDLLGQMRALCAGAECRHRTLSEHFGQVYEKADCGACDVCLGDVEGVEDATVTAQKILSCVARVEQRFGLGHVADVLHGADTDMVRRCGHQQLSTYRLMQDTPRKAIVSLAYQLVDQGVLERTEGDRPILRLNDTSWAVLRGEREVRLRRPMAKPVGKTRAEADSWEGVDQGLFEHLRGIRRELAGQRGVPAYLVFGDRALRDMARLKPTSPAELMQVRGVGERKLADFGERFINEVCAYCGLQPS